MAGSGSDSRQRQRTLSARFNRHEEQAVRERADRAGVSVAAYIRHTTLDAPLTRAARRPTLNHVEAARLVGELGRARAAVTEAAAASKLDPSTRELISALRGLSIACVAIMKSLGRDP